MSGLASAIFRLFLKEAEEVHEPHTRNIHVAAINQQVYLQSQSVYMEHIHMEPV